MLSKTMSKFISYEQAGVSIDANDEMVEQVHHHVASTFGQRVMEIKDGYIAYIVNRSSKCRYCLNMWTPFQSFPGVVLIYFSHDSLNRSTDLSLW